jgi:hypothetical protein
MKNIELGLKLKLVQLTLNWWEGKLGPTDRSFVEEEQKFSINEADGSTCIINHNDRKMGVLMNVGSHNVQGWLNDFDIGLVRKMVKKWSDKTDVNNAPIVPYGNDNSKIRVHRGFSSMYIRNTRDMARDFAKKCKDRGIDLIVTGHSLGAVETVLTYIDWHYLFHSELGIPADQMDFLTGFAVACPGVGNKEFVESFLRRSNGNFYSEAVWTDPVTMVPGPWMGYQQIPIKYYSDFWNTLSTPFSQSTNIASLGLLPGIAFHNHHPLRLLYGLQGKALPPVNL